MSDTVLVIDDEPQLRRLLRVTLEGQGFRVADADCGAVGITEVALRRPDAVVLDLGLPDMDGADVVRRVREWCQVPILVLSVRDSTAEKVSALEAGADDFVTKPFDGAELAARLRALIRRSARPTGDPVFTSGPLTIDFAAHAVLRDGQPLKLTATEFALLKALATHANKVVLHRQLLREVWGPHAEPHRQYLRVHLAALRKKLGPAATIHTEPGIGYRLAAE